MKAGRCWDSCIRTESRDGTDWYLVIVEKYGPGSYGAYVPELPGIGVAGETEDEVRGLVAEAIMLYVDELERDENAAAESVVVNHYTIAVR